MANIHEAERLNPPQNAERFALFSALKGEMTALATTDEEHAYTMTRVTDLSTHEATLQQRAPHLLRVAIEDVSTSVKAFEALHPTFVETVNTISTL
jgi:hypothetical protein